MPTDSPTRELIEKFYSRKTDGRMTRPARASAGDRARQPLRTAKRFEAGAGATFIDYFNGELMPGIEMSGGYGVFAPAVACRRTFTTSTRASASCRATRRASSRAGGIR
jgi:hypothetical protein